MGARHRTQMKSVVLFAALALALYCTCSEAASSSSSTGSSSAATTSSSSTGSSSAATTKGKCTEYAGGHKGATASCTMCINIATTSDGATTVLAQTCDTSAGGKKYCNKYGIGSGKCKKSTQTSGGKTVKMTIYCSDSDIAGGVKPSGVTCTTYSGASAMTTVSLVSVVTMLVAMFH